ncbi:MAG: T9SS type A sorting domain-containing protein, partial [FCB group bacterium]
IPDTSANVGTKDFPIQLKITNPNQIPFQNIDYTCEIAYDETLFLSSGWSDKTCITKDTIINYERILVLEGKNISINNKENLLGEIYGLVLLADSDKTPIHIRKFSLSDTNIVIQTQDGSLTIRACTLELRRVALRDLTTMQIEPNPANNEVEIKISGDEEGPFLLNLYNLQGFKIDSKVLNYKKKDGNSFKLKTSDYPDGFYQCILQSPAAYISKPLMIVK